jgi:hypothetical protein
MSTDNYPIKPDSALHRLVTMVAEEVAKEFSVKTSLRPTVKQASGKRGMKDKSK